ncbi:DUF5808 domain-containing protein [Corynebacterium sp. A21]|uniref:DUF5808 domain-containing protein n=1 Tax=Corynebacterium sp. A21 TaxID=3457318 RepID=UPI003FD1BFFF
MPHSTTDYLHALRTQLENTSLTAGEVADLLGEHRDLITELATTDADLNTELGSPTEYAAATAAEFTPGQKDTSGPQGTLAGVPYDFRGPYSRQARSRIWNPQDPHILQPRLFGLGWTINFGAVAVKLGWIRPDDIDADVVAAIPEKMLLAAKAVPAALAGATMLTLATGWRELPDTLPMKYHLSGAPHGKRSPKASLLSMPALGAVFAVLPFLPAKSTDREDALRVSSMGSFIGALALGTAASAVAGARGAKRPGLFSTAALGVGVAAAGGVLILPFRSGLNQVWRREGVK